MKRIFILFFAILITVSLVGQSVLKNHRNEGQRDETIKILKQITKNNANLSNPFFSPNDSKQAMDSLIYEEYYEFDEGWSKSEKEEYIWDESGKVILKTHSGWRSDYNQWYSYQKTNHYYDGGGRLLNMNMQYRDLIINIDWIDWEKTALTYQGDLGVSAVMSFWQPEFSQWVIPYRYEYVFDNDGKILEITYYYNEEVPENWLNGEKYEYFYDGDGKMVQELWSIWDINNGNWWNVYKVDYSYEGNGNLIKELWNHWNYNTLVWENESKYVFIYDDHGNIAEYTESWWEFDIEDWLVEEKVTFSYNNDYTYSDLILPASSIGYFSFLNVLLFNHMLLTEEVFEAWGETLDEDTRTTYYYSENNASGVELNNVDGFLIYPNPASDYFSIELNNISESVLVEIFDNYGRMVSSQEIIENQPISVSDLDRGIYFYKFVYNGNLSSGKIVVQ